MRTSAFQVDRRQITVIAVVLLLILSASAVTAAEYGAVYTPSPSVGPAPRAQPGQTGIRRVNVKNTGTLTWPSNSSFKLSYHWYRGSAEVIHDGLRTPLPAVIAPGQSIDLNANVKYPDTAGTYMLKWDMIREGVAWFSEKGVPTKDVWVNVGFGDLAVRNLTVRLTSTDFTWDAAQVSVVVTNLGPTMETDKELVIMRGSEVIKRWVSSFPVGASFTITCGEKFQHHTPGTALIPTHKAVISDHLPTAPGGFVLSEPWDKDQSNNTIWLQENELTLHGRPLPADALITSFTAVPVGGSSGQLRLTTVMKNQLSVKLTGLKLTLVKNHLTVKEWMPINLGPGAVAQTHYLDALPAPFQTNYYIAILSTGDPIRDPQSVLDRKETKYRRSGTVTGG